MTFMSSMLITIHCRPTLVTVVLFLKSKPFHPFCWYENPPMDTNVVIGTYRSTMQFKVPAIMLLALLSLLVTKIHESNRFVYVPNSNCPLTAKVLLTHQAPHPTHGSKMSAYLWVLC